MRVKRAKLVRKYLRFFKIVYGIQPPYNVILDGNFIFTAIKLKLDIRDRVGKLLQGEEVKYFITQSILDELQSIGSKGKESHDFACKFCEVVNDRHFAGVDGTERLRSLLNESCEVLNLLLDDPLALIFNLGSDSSKKGKKMYFVASQDKDLRTSIGTIAGVPIIYLNAVTFVLEPPSASSRAQNVQIEAAKISLTETEAELVKEVKEDGDGGSVISTDEVQPLGQVRKKRKASAPNPLSCPKASLDSVRTKKKKIEKYVRAK